MIKNIQTNIPARIWRSQTGRVLILVLLASSFMSHGLFRPVASLASGTVSCSGCHGNPPIDGTARNTPAGQFQGSHSQHSGSAAGQYGYLCTRCHANNGTTNFSHANGIIEINSPLNGEGAGRVYSRVNPAVSNTFTPGTCSTYCHSDGKAAPAYYATPTWGTAASGNCGTCHRVQDTLANMQAAGSPPAVSAAHFKHLASDRYGLNSAYNCGACHADTASDNVTLLVSGGKHVNNARDYKFGTFGGINQSGGTYTTSCASTYCHSKGRLTTPPFTAPMSNILWSAGYNSDTCVTCHAGNDTYANVNTNGPFDQHKAHIATDQYNFTCDECHAETMANDSSTTLNAATGYSKHVNGAKDYKFSTTIRATAISQSAGTYSASTCANIYCHSTGTRRTNDPVTYPYTVLHSPYQAPNWTGTLGCNGCHGDATYTTGRPDYTNGTPKANSHVAHAAYTCEKCHYATTTTGTTITNFTNHVNTIYNVSNAAGTLTYAAGTVAANGIPAAGTCSGTGMVTGCHGNSGSFTWGATLKCQDCHLTTADVDNFVYGNGTVATVKNVGEWDTTGHGKASGTYASGNNAAVFTVANACLYCHETTVNHGDGTNVFRLKNFADATWGKNGVCTSCHVAGSTGVTIDTVLKNGGKKVSAYHNGVDHTALKNGGQFCWDCHDPHGDTNAYMIHSAVAKTSDTTTGAPTATASVTFTAFATGTDYAGANATKLCNACHTTASHYAGASGDGHNSGVRCTNCHSHNNSNKTYGFSAGESTGGSACGACHSDLYNSDQTKYSMHSNVAGISYKHYLDNDAASYSTTLPNGPSTNLTSRKCTMCHVDHTIFKVTATATAGRAFNMRPNAGISPTAGSNTDLINCTSCHYQVTTKAIAAPFSEADSMQIPFPGLTFANATSMIKSSTHGYPVASQEFADSTLGNTTFYANCTKCHNDTIGKNSGAKSSYNAQDGTQSTRSRFGNHQTTNNNFFSVFNNDSLGQFFQGTATSATNTTNATISVTGAGWTANQWVGYYVVTTGGTGQNQRKMITSNTATILTLSGTFTTALDATTKFDIVQASINTDNVCFACHSHRNQGKGARAGFDWYSSMPIRSELEGMDDTFIILADTGTVSSYVTGTSASAPPTMTDTTKSWTTNQLRNYTIKFTNGVVRKIVSNTSNTVSLTFSKRVGFSVSNGMAYEIFKPAYHPLDEYGRHNSIERVAPVKRSYNQGDMGEITGYISTTQFTDNTRAWSASQWNGSVISFPKQGATATISSVTLDANSVPTITFSPAVSGLAVGDAYFIGTRHVSCADCHNSHSAQPYPFGQVTTAASAGGTTLQANDAKNPTGITKWVNNQWTGYLLRVRSATTNLEQIRYITGYTASTGTFTVGLPWNTAIAANDHFDVITSDRWTSTGHDAGRAGSGSAGVWGIQIGGWTTPTAGSFQNMTTATYTKVENVYDRTGTLGGNSTAGQRDLCVRCHSYYAYGNKPSTTTTPGPLDAATGSSGPTPSTDVAQEFNPNNSSHHAVYARGNNQPLKANYGQVGITSYMNPNWPIYINAGNVSVASGTATLTTSGLPRTALPGWYIYIGSKTRTATAGAAGTASTGYLEITSISSPTSFTVRAANGSGGWVTNLTIASNANWYVTAGLGNGFIPPYGPWSILLCTDCHGSTKTDPLGPHASANDFLLKSMDTAIQFEWFDGASVTTVQPNNKTATQLDTNLGRQVFCWNCHRSDVYANGALHGTPTKGNMGRVNHNELYCSSATSVASSIKLEAIPSTALPPGWQIWCKHCHGGDKVGGTHGTNGTFATGDAGLIGTPRKRFLNGATWVGYGKPTTAVGLSCYTQNNTQSSSSAVSSCNQHQGGSNPTPNIYSTYDYW